MARITTRGVALGCFMTLAAPRCSRPAPVVTPPTPSPALANGADASDAPAPSARPADPAVAKVTQPLAPESVAISPAVAREVLFLDDARSAACADAGASPIACLVAARYASDANALAVATALYASTGDVAGLSPAETMEGGFRGTLHLVPELPVGARRKHLEWVAAAAADYDEFFGELGHDAGAAAFPYRWRDLSLRFMRSVGRTTPSAYASGWSVAYNVDGSLNTSKDAVRELLFHEIFHLNDAAHGDWSKRTLGPIFDAIVARCHTAVPCLAPYAPTSTLVRGGTYYAFQENNGEAVHEYAAELALRYYREQRAALRHEKAPARYKCGPEENARAWSLLAGEFFNGQDRTPACR